MKNEEEKYQTTCTEQQVSIFHFPHILRRSLVYRSDRLDIIYNYSKIASSCNLFFGDVSSFFGFLEKTRNFESRRASKSFLKLSAVFCKHVEIRYIR